MARMALDISRAIRRRIGAARELSHPHCLSIPLALFLSCTVFGATDCRAQDVADAARQEHTRKESQAKHPKHVYTEEDLRRPHILTPEDQAQIEAKRKSQSPPLAKAPAEQVDAQALPPGAPLGDVARRLRREKQLRQQQSQQTSEFHLPLSNPSFAAPKPALRPPLKPLLIPPAKREPAPTPGPVPHRVDPFLPAPRRYADPLPVVPRATRRDTPEVSALEVLIVRPGDSLWKLAQQNLGRGIRWQELLAVNPQITDPDRLRAGARIYVPASATARLSSSTIQVRRGDSLWKIAQTRLGNAYSWPCIARANLQLRDADHIYEGQRLILPAKCGP